MDTEDTGDNEVSDPDALEGEASEQPTRKVYSPPTTFQIEKSRIKGINVGHEISVVIKGEIVSIRKAIGETGHSSMVEIEIARPKVTEVESNSADLEFRRMMAAK